MAESWGRWGSRVGDWGFDPFRTCRGCIGPGRREAASAHARQPGRGTRLRVPSQLCGCGAIPGWWLNLSVLSLSSAEKPGE